MQAVDTYSPPPTYPQQRIPRFHLTGTQTFAAQTLGPVNLTPEDQFMMVGDTNRATADGSGATLGGTRTWWWVPGDTLATPQGIGGTATVKCNSATLSTCKFAVTSTLKSGRLYLSGFTVDGFTWQGPTPVSPIIWVGKVPDLLV